FPDTLFKTKILRKIGGLPEKYISGDTYIKRKITAQYNAVLVAQAVSWWRRTPGQASQNLKKEITGIIEQINYNRELLNDKNCPLDKLTRLNAINNITGSFLRMVFYDYFIRFKWIKTVKILKLMKFKFSDIKSFFTKGKYDYTADASAVNPLITNF
ncbi:MAG: hypothetical protein U9Q83_05350, partial [Bacteroidota bacterium]|nr:hypothetical protein [Bacteroidota bacterium]